MMGTGAHGAFKMADRTSVSHVSPSIEEQVRICVREELASQSRGNLGVQSLVQRTRQLINASASSAAGRLSGTAIASQNNGRNESSGGRETPKRANTVPAHSLRFKKKAAKAPTAKVQVPKSVYLLRVPEVNADEEYGLIDNMIILKGQFDLSPESSEDDLRTELVSLFKTKLPLVTNFDFDFVRRDRNTISVPVVKENHKWDFKHVKHLCGTGRLYVRLNVPEYTLESPDEETESAESVCEETGMSTQQASQLNVQPDSRRMLRQVPNEASTSRESQSTIIDDSVDSLSSIFTNTSRETVRESVLAYQNIELAADALSQDMVMEKPEENKDVHQILNKLKFSMKPYMYSEKLKVDKEDIVMDFFHYYKSSEFDPSVPIKVQMRGEPAVDTGGVLRQSFTDVFAEIVNGSSCLRLFRGVDASRLTPVYSSEHVLTGVFEVLGKMIAHSLIQGGPGFPFLAPSIYWYVATGDLSEAVARCSFLDVGDHELACFVERIKDGSADDINEISQDSSFVRFMQECGETRVLTDKNKEEVVQSLVLHDTIVKHKAILDQLRKGLSILGLQNELEKAPGKFEHLFVHKDDEVSAAYVKELLRPPTSSDAQVQQVVQMLYAFLQNSSKDDLLDFLCFATGSRSSTSMFVPGSIRVSVGDTEGIFASTCTLELKLPSSFSSYAQFESIMKVVLKAKGKKYTTA